MSVYMITGEGKEEFYNQLKELLGDKINGVNAVVFQVQDSAEITLESYNKTPNENMKPFYLTKIYC